MSWNYRIVKKSEDHYTIIEVYYDENGKIKGWSDCNALTWNNPADLIGTIQMLQTVIGKPILEEINGELIEKS